MNQSAILAIVIVLSSVGFASGTDICGNAPCEPQINASLGEEFAVSLESNPSTGFEWWTKFDPNYLSLMNSTFVKVNEMPELLGVPGKHEFAFSAISAGDTDVIMLLLRPWENGTIVKCKIFPINIISAAAATKQATVLGSGMNPERTALRTGSFRSSSGMGTNTIFSGQPIRIAYGISSNYYLNESEMETPSQAVSRHEPVGYDLTPLGKPNL